MAQVDRGPILIIDDNRDHSESLQLLLETLGYPVHVIHDGSAALAYLRQGGSARIIVLDLNMPGIPGEQVLRELQFDDQCAQIPVIVLSGNVGQAPMPQAFAQLPKGVDPVVLVALVAKAWGRDAE